VFQFHIVTAKTAESRTETCWCLSRTSAALWSRWWLRNKNCHWDKTWVHYNQQETKRASKEWHHPSSPKLMKFRMQPSVGKVMLTLFWDEWGIILEHSTPRGNIVTSATYTDLLGNHLWPAIKSKQRGLLSTGVLLQHDKACFHTTSETVATIEDLHFESLLHPLYSPPVITSLGNSKEAMGGKTFRPNEEMQQVVHEWLHMWPKDFFSRGIHALCKHWRTYIKCNGDYIEKWHSCVLLLRNYEKKNKVFAWHTLVLAEWKMFWTFVEKYKTNILW
jgi:hypothetical protein